jgi:hypothetical protein
MDQPGAAACNPRAPRYSARPSGKQRGRAVTFIVMSYALPIPETQWQHRLRTLKGLALTFLIYSQHQGVVGRVRPAHSFSMNRRKQ